MTPIIYIRCYPFGMLVPNRHANTLDYRYGYNGMEMDDELKGEGNSINYEARMQDTRIGRFLSIDPLAGSFAHYSPYQFAGNTPIQAIDLDGAEEYYYLASFDKKKGTITFKLESSKTVKERYFLWWSWVPKETHTVVYQNSDGDKSTYVFTQFKHIRLGMEYLEVNKIPDFRKFVKESGSIIYGSEDDAKHVLDRTFASNEAILIGDFGGALIDASLSDAFTRNSDPDIKTTSTSVEKVNGRFPINSKYAGKSYTFEANSGLAKKYPKGVAFNKSGYPEFTPYSKKTVDIGSLNKSSPQDIAKANKISGYDKTPENFLWHHVENSTKLQLVPKDLHDAVRHTGGRATNAPK